MDEWKVMFPYLNESLVADNELTKSVVDSEVERVKLENPDVGAFMERFVEAIRELDKWDLIQWLIDEGLQVGDEIENKLRVNHIVLTALRSMAVEDKEKLDSEDIKSASDLYLSTISIHIEKTRDLLAGDDVGEA